MKRAFAVALLTCSIASAAPNPLDDDTGIPPNPKDFGMGPVTTKKVAAAAAEDIPDKMAAGPFQPTWESVEKNYRAPEWLGQAKFGIFMHWGLYSVAAYHNEWYEKHMYAAYADWHKAHFGPQDQFGYKDLIPKFTAAKFDPAAWAKLFKESGARYVVPSAQHHDNYPLWDSALTPINAKQTGPHRDLIGDLAKAVRAEGLKFGVSNHGIENFTFINPRKDIADDLKAKQADLYDPKWATFYNVADRSDAACQHFLTDWVRRNVELIDKYQPDLIYFDNGANHRFYDPLKLFVAAYYYNRAAEWNKQVSICTKAACYAPSNDPNKQIGAVIDFEKVGNRSPTGIRGGTWQIDDPISGSSWGYVDGMKYNPTGKIIEKLVDTVSKNGNYLLNISPKADGTIPQEQQEILLAIGKWLKLNGTAIYDTHAWTTFDETPAKGEAGANVRYTVGADGLNAILLGKWMPGEVVLKSITPQNTPAGNIVSVKLLGGGNVAFKQEADGLHLTLAGSAPCDFAYVLQIVGVPVNASLATPSGNPK